MKKIATITFHRAANYGAVLQTYALHKSIASLGVETEVIDYRCEYIENHYKKFSFSKLKDIKTILKLLLTKQFICDNREKCMGFVNENIKLSRPIYDREELAKLNDEYNTFICGSDQVWSPVCAGFDTTYFLDFVKDNNKKNSYAASFGVSTIDDEFVDKYKDLLSEFRSISVRETTGKEIVKRLIDKDVRVVADPTMLIDKDEWSLLCESVQLPKHYVLLYLLSRSEFIISFAKEFAKKKNIEIVFLNTWTADEKGCINLRKLTIGQWLYTFKKAEYIITNSFHGLVFSLLFEKDFYVGMLSEKAKTNSRLLSLINAVGVENRIVSQDYICLNSKLDYKSISKVIAEMKKESKEFLMEIVYNAPVLHD